MLEKESQNHEFLVIVDELLDSINSGDIIANKVGIFFSFGCLQNKFRKFSKIVGFNSKISEFGLIFKFSEIFFRKLFQNRQFLMKF